MRISKTDYSPILIQYRYPTSNITKPIPFDEVSFGNEQKHSKKYYKAKNYANFIKFMNYFRADDISSYNLDKLEGIQENLSSFKDLSIKDIIFICRDLNAISLVRGCSNKCLHCYVGAEPSSDKSTQYINRMQYEDFDQLMKDFKTLKNRIGITPFNYKKNTPYLTTFVDSDGMNIVLYDKHGKLHDFTEINDKIYDATNIKQVFDTAGWNPKDPRMQTLAEKYVKYFMNPNNTQKMYQVNLSISPFNPLYLKSRMLGYDPTKYKPSIEELDNIYTGDTAGEKLYKIYINRMANMLFTFSQLIPLYHLGVISRTPSKDAENMEFFTQEEHKINKKNILENLKMRYEHDLNNDKKVVTNRLQIEKYFEYYNKSLYKPDDKGLIVAGRYKELYKQRNPQLQDKDFEEKFGLVEKSNLAYQNIHDLLTGKTKPITLDTNTTIGNNIKYRYYKIIDVNGKVYLFDNYRLLPTEIQLNLSTKDMQTPKLNIKTEDVIINKDITRKSI